MVVKVVEAREAAAMAVATVEEGKAAATGEVVRVEETVAAEKGGATVVAEMAVATVGEGKEGAGTSTAASKTTSADFDNDALRRTIELVQQLAHA